MGFIADLAIMLRVGAKCLLEIENNVFLWKCAKLLAEVGVMEIGHLSVR